MAVVWPAEPWNAWQTTSADRPDAGIHPMANEVTIDAVAQGAKRLTMVLIKHVRIIECSKIAGDAGLLDLSLIHI